jgi:hypothetical protein
VKFKEKGFTMILNDKQRADFHEAVKPLLQFLNENCYPHCSVIVEIGRAELLEGCAAIVDESYIKD